MTTYITSDIHIGHENKEAGTGIIPYTGRPYVDVAEMERELEAIFCSVLTPNDTLIVAGDAAMGKREETLKFFSRIPGKKALVTGNHDHIHPMFKKGKIEKWMPIYLEHFDIICQQMALQIGTHTVNVNHFPYEGDHSETRHNAEQIDKWRPIFDGRYLLHGHVHAEDIGWGENQIHIGLDSDWTYYGVERYHPIHLETVLTVIEELETAKRNADDEPF